MSCPGFDFLANCTDNGPVEFDADPDVAGIGVILAFLISAWTTYLFIIITFFFVESFDGITNELDILVVQRSRKIKTQFGDLLRERYGLYKSDHQQHAVFSSDTIEKIAFTLSDQQLITGMSIFIVGFQRHCVITQYHFYVVYLLGVLSFSTHQSTMMIVRKKLSERPWMRWWRLAAIFCIFLFSFLSNILVYNTYFLEELGFVMQCIWTDLPRYYDGAEVALTILTSVFLFWGFAAVTRELCPPIRDFFTGHMSLGVLSPQWWHDLTSKKLEEVRRPLSFQGDSMKQILRLMLNGTLFTFYLLVFTVIQIFASRIFDLYRVWTTLFYSTFAVVGIRYTAAEATTLDDTPALIGDENTWGFGQILPMLLLALPTFQVWEMIWEDVVRNRKSLTGEEDIPMHDMSSSNNEQYGRRPDGAELTLQAEVSHSNVSTKKRDTSVTNLYGTRWLQLWLLLWVLLLFGLTTWGATQGIVF